MTYYADKEGNIYNENGRPLKYWINSSGYYYFKMYLGKDHNPKVKAMAVHRFVYEYFNEPIPKKLTIDHINNDRLDNRLENLRVLSNAANCRRRDYNKLDMTKAKVIRELYSQGNMSMDKLAKMYDVSKTTIHNCILNRTWNEEL